MPTALPLYLGATVTALNVIFGSLLKTSYTNTATTDNNIAAGYRAKAASFPVARVGERAAALARASDATAAARHATTMAGDIGLVVGLGGLIGVVCWLVIAGACRRGRGWTRVVGTVLLGLDTAGLLWSRQARDFFAYYRR